MAIGYVARAHGVRGELRVHTHDARSTTLFDVDRVWIDGVEHELRSVRPTTGAVLVAVRGVEDRDQADALRGRPVEVARDDVPLGEHEVFLADLPGCDVFTVDGARLGTIDRVVPGPQDLLAIRDERGERLLPIVPAFVIEVDLGARRVVVDPPDDLPIDPIERSRS